MNREVVPSSHSLSCSSPVVVSVDVKNHERRSAAESNSGEAVSAVRSSRR